MAFSHATPCNLKKLLCFFFTRKGKIWAESPGLASTIPPGVYIDVYLAQAGNACKNLSVLVDNRT
jgi:hypothetical protein